MAINDEEYLRISLVLLNVSLIQQDADVERFRSLVKAEVSSVAGMTARLGLDVPVEIRRLSIDRERITIESTNDRTTLTRDYPEMRDIARFAELAQHAISVATSVSEMRGVGYNVELMYDQSSGSSAAVYLGRRLFKGFSQEGGWTLAGGHGTASFIDGEDTWNCQVEPRLQEADTTKVFLAVNRHRRESNLPSAGEIEQRLQGAWNRAREFALRLDRQL